MISNFRLFISIEPGEVVFKCKGRLDASAACEILRRLEECCDRRRPVIIDLERIDDSDPLGMSVLKSAVNGRHLKLGRRVLLSTGKEEN
jgi:anti-anti-sigma regulatory factor